MKRLTKLTLTLFGVTGLLGWAVYKSHYTRVIPSPMPVDTGWQTDPNTVVDLNQFTADVGPIYCQPWDIGTGVMGYHWPAPNPRAVLLLQHGYAEYAQRYVQHYNRLIPHLLAAGISVYALDLWGHGYSPGKRALTDLDQAVDDHLTARHKLHNQPLPVFLLGHSLGGLVTAASVTRDQHGLSGVILSSALLKRAEGEIKRLIANLMAFVGPTLPTPVKKADINSLASPTEIEAFTNDGLIYHGRRPILLAATILNLIKETRLRYSEWNVPTLLMHGTGDKYTDPRGSQQFFDTIGSRDKTFYLVAGGRHELLNDTKRDETLQVLLNWLEDRL